MPMHIRAILYDLDGVLVNACDWHYHSLNDALKKYMNYTIPYEEHIQTYNGLSTKVKLDILNVPEHLKEDIWNYKQERTIEVIKKYSSIDEQKIKLHQWADKKDIIKACVTNTIRETATLMLEKTGQLQYMSFLICNEDVERNKPFPDCYLKAMRQLNLSPLEVLIVEDSDKGKKAAYNSKAHVLEVSSAKEVTLNNIRAAIK